MDAVDFARDVSEILRCIFARFINVLCKSRDRDRVSGTVSKSSLLLSATGSTLGRCALVPRLFRLARRKRPKKSGIREQGDEVFKRSRGRRFSSLADQPLIVSQILRHRLHSLYF